MNRFIEAIRNMFRVEDLRKRVLFTLALLAVYRIGAHIPTPGINVTELERIFTQAQGSALGLFDLFSGGNFRNLTIFALGIMPYITASIILQLMQVVFPYLERLQKEGELGRQKITQYTRYLTIALSIIQSLTIAGTLQSQANLVYHPGLPFVLMIAVVAFIVFMEGGQRRIPVQYAKRVVGRRVMGGQSSYLPLRVNSGGVIPPIFASSLLAFPATIALALNHRYAFVDTIQSYVNWG